MRRLRILNGRDIGYLLIGLVLGSTGLVIAQTTVMEVEGDLDVAADAIVGGELDVSSDASIGGNLNIGTFSSGEDLTVTGAIGVRRGLDPDDDESYAKIYAKGFTSAYLWAMDGDGDTTQLTSHADPRDYGEPESTSFADPTVDLPFSFHHANRLLGQGAVVDLAAAVRDLQALTGKSYTTVYDLPEASTQEVLERYEWIEIPFEEATEEVEVMLPETRTVFDYDRETGETFQVEEPTGEPSDVGTGAYERRLKENVRFDKENGKFLRQPTLAEIPQGATPDLPAWIAERLPSSQ